MSIVFGHKSGRVGARLSRMVGWLKIPKTAVTHSQPIDLSSFPRFYFATRKHPGGVQKSNSDRDRIGRLNAGFCVKWAIGNCGATWRNLAISIHTVAAFLRVHFIYSARPIRPKVLLMMLPATRWLY